VGGPPSGRDGLIPSAEECTLELRIKGLSKRYPNGVQALSEVDLTIPAGMFGLLGPNGAGKSTLMLAELKKETPAEYQQLLVDLFSSTGPRTTI
jgi:ABC-type multidrug transport system ATPase subunit